MTKMPAIDGIEALSTRGGMWSWSGALFTFSLDLYRSLNQVELMINNWTRNGSFWFQFLAIFDKCGWFSGEANVLLDFQGFPIFKMTFQNPYSLHLIFNIILLFSLSVIYSLGAHLFECISGRSEFHNSHGFPAVFMHNWWQWWITDLRRMVTMRLRTILLAS